MAYFCSFLSSWNYRTSPSTSACRSASSSSLFQRFFKESLAAFFWLPFFDFFCSFLSAFSCLFLDWVEGEGSSSCSSCSSYDEIASLSLTTLPSIDRGIFDSSLSLGGSLAALLFLLQSMA